MEERSNKTIMCSVLFLDIVEYSKKSVSGQISLKDRFNSYLSEAIRDVPVTDRIILDTGDGAAINFLGDVEDALKAALSLRESLLNEDPDVEHPLLVRMGVNLGPVRLVRDINGQPNIVGDGINVAQRVMGFADVAQILVSRSYYDAVSRLSPHYAGMFHYQGSRTDKHVREHEVYAIGYPGDKTTLRGRVSYGQAESVSSGGVNAVLDAAIHLAQTGTRNALMLYREAEPAQRVMYVGAVSVPVLLLLALLVNWVAKDDEPAKPVAGNGVQTIAPAEPVAVDDVAASPQVAAAEKQGAKVVTPGEESKPTAAKKPRTSEVKPKVQRDIAKKPAIESPRLKSGVWVVCTEGTEVFVDGVRKGSVGSRPFRVDVPSGTHTVIVSHPRGGIYSQEVNMNSDKAVEIRPKFCE